MPYTVERLPPPVPLIKAADHSTDHQRKGHDRNDPAHTETPLHEDAAREVVADAAEDPAVLVDAHHDAAQQLDGVAAYQATAEHAKQALRMRHDGAGQAAETEIAATHPAPAAPGAAYGPHPPSDDEHKVNLAT